VLLFSLVFAFLFSIPAAAKNIKYQMNCDLGKEPSQTQHLSDFTVMLLPSDGACHVSILDVNKKSVFDSTAPSMQIFVGHGLAAVAAPFALVQANLFASGSNKLFIISLGQSPHLVQTVDNRYGFWLQDDCDGQLRIWTSDGAFQNNTDLIDVYHHDVFTPPVVFEVRQGELFDATSECRQYFDKAIADARSKLSEQKIETFRSGGTPEEAAQGLVRGRILYIVFCYLYTGRENEARQTLQRMWPPQDTDRLWKSVIKLRAEGVLAQINKKP
jgi:hypothetical protein